MTYLGVGLLLAALALLALFRADREGNSHSAISSPLVSALFPSLVLALITFGTAVLLSRMLG
jgi:hypothetical protein